MRVYHVALKSGREHIVDANNYREVVDMFGYHKIGFMQLIGEIEEEITIEDVQRNSQQDRDKIVSICGTINSIYEEAMR